jgi:hypothetical protein
MVNSKKMNKSTVAVIVLALLLVLSLVLTATGAWFTDKEAGETVNKNFGTVEMKVTANDFGKVVRVSNDEGPVAGDVMPGDTISYSILVEKEAESEEFWYAVVLTISGLGEGNDITTTVTADNVMNTVEDTEAIAKSILLEGEKFGDTYQGQPITVSYAVYAVQYANVDAALAAQLINAQIGA